MSWSEVLLALLVSHVAGDVLLQTEEQALRKRGGLHDAGARRALAAHVATYSSAFIPVLVWIGLERTALRAVGVAALVASSHLVVDDGRLVGWWVRSVKRAANPSRALSIAVDQSFHVLCLLGVALVAVS